MKLAGNGGPQVVGLAWDKNAHAAGSHETKNQT
jgi:hypothetical protein